MTLELRSQWLYDGDSDARVGARILLSQYGRTVEIGKCAANVETEGTHNVLAHALEDAATWLRAGKVDLRDTGAGTART